METQTNRDKPMAGDFPFVLIQGQDGTYTIQAGLAAEDAVRKEKEGLLEGILMGGGTLNISTVLKMIFTVPFRNLDGNVLLQIERIMDNYARQIGYKSWMYGSD
ncbi:MAG: hypothetical protein QME12_05340 [Nanoarchaeota archaeon]|nr:hypothetical protein [Nanoarchaeota archaeon]